jgi:hypothetical protein
MTVSSHARSVGEEHLQSTREASLVNQKLKCDIILVLGVSTSVDNEDMPRLKVTTTYYVSNRPKKSLANTYHLTDPNTTGLVGCRHDLNRTPRQG